MNVTYPGREEGNAKEEGRSKHTPTHLARSGRTLKRQGKRKKRRPTDTDQDQRRGGKTEVPEPT